MSDFALDASAVQGATDDLLTALAELDEDACARPSRLPGWTRGHIVAHLARNADALVNLLTWARTGVRTPMYPSDTARDADIERDAGRPLPVQLADLRDSSFRFNSAAAALPRERWTVEVDMRNGVTERAARLPFRRLIEVHLHHIDLDVGYTLRDLPSDFVERELDFLTGVKFAGHPDLPDLRLVAGESATTGGTARRTGRPDAPPVTVSGSPTALLGWLTGRADGGDLSTDADVPPRIPSLG